MKNEKYKEIIKQAVDKLGLAPDVEQLNEDFIEQMLKYQERHPEIEININDFMDKSSDKNYASYPDEWVEWRTDDDHNDYALPIYNRVLSTNLNIYKLLNINCEQIQDALNAYENGVPEETIYQAINICEKTNKIVCKGPKEYSYFGPIGYNLKTVLDIMNDGALAFAFKANKELEDLKSIPFCNEALSNYLTEDNSTELMSMLKLYANSDSSELKNFLSEKITSGVFIKVSNNLNLEQVKEIMYALEKNVTNMNYLNGALSAEAMHALTNAYVGLDNGKDEYGHAIEYFDKVADGNFKDEIVILTANYMLQTGNIISYETLYSKDISIEKAQLLLDIDSVISNVSKEVSRTDSWNKYSPEWNNLWSLYEMIGNENDKPIAVQRAFCAEKIANVLNEYSEKAEDLESKTRFFEITKNFPTYISKQENILENIAEK